MNRYLGEWKTFFGIPDSCIVKAATKALALTLITADAVRQSYGGNLDKQTIRVVKKLMPGKNR